MSKQKTAPKYSPEVRERTVRMVHEHASQWAVIVLIATKIGCTPQTLHNWVVQTERDRGRRGGVTSDERARMAVRLARATGPMGDWNTLVRWGSDLA